LEFVIFLFYIGLELSTSKLKYKHPTKRYNVDGCVKIYHEKKKLYNHIYRRAIVTSLMIISYHLPEKKNLKIKWRWKALKVIYKRRKLKFKNDGPKTLINFNMVGMKPSIAMLLKTCMLVGERSVTQNTCHVEYTFF